MRGKPAPNSSSRASLRSIPACAGETSRDCGNSLGKKVYPRVCGGNGLGLSAFALSKGLSPRVRGKLYPQQLALDHIRSIPACAGETIVGVCVLLLLQVYPRVCGGNRGATSDGMMSGGLSPRVRGKPSRPISMPGSAGSIPACAGETPQSGVIWADAGVYPRVCGGNCPGRPRCSSYPGLSPRVRGKRRPRSSTAAPERSIPACAGETTGTAFPPAVTAVYPRVCGGNYSSGVGSRPSRGLSPRVRGKPSLPVGRTTNIWSIPACAGETRRARTPKPPVEVYPRVCGGNRGGATAGRPAHGLSPRVRGKLECVDSDVQCEGSIPACAGETSRLYAKPFQAQVYPRVCGGNAGGNAGAHRRRGLSPRVRGKRLGLKAAVFAARSIPACVGNRSHCAGIITLRGLSPRVRGKHSRPMQQAPQPGSIPACAGETNGRAWPHTWPPVYPRVCGGNWRRNRPPEEKMGLSPRVRGKPMRRR